MNGAALINSVCYDVGKIQTVTTDTNLRLVILDWLNRTIRFISSKHKHWTWLEKTAYFNTVASQMSYDMPSDIDLSGRKIFTLRQKDSPTKLTYIDQKYFDELEPNPTGTGNPEFYTIYASNLRLYPIPASAIVIYERYLKTITSLTDASSSTTDIPEKFDEIILAGAKVHAFRMFPKWGDSKEQKIIFEAGIDDMIRDNNVALDDDGTQYKHRIRKPEMRRVDPYDESNVG